MFIKHTHTFDNSTLIRFEFPPKNENKSNATRDTHAIHSLRRAASPRASFVHLPLLVSVCARCALSFQLILLNSTDLSNALTLRGCLNFGSFFSLLVISNKSMHFDKRNSKAILFNFFLLLEMSKVHIKNSFWCSTKFNMLQRWAAHSLESKDNDFEGEKQQQQKKLREKLIRIVRLIRSLHLYVNSLISTWWTGGKKYSIHVYYYQQNDTQRIIFNYILHLVFVRKRKTKVAQLQNMCVHVRIAFYFLNSYEKFTVLSS